MTTTVILDCDNACGLPGRDIDDALTLAYLLGREDIEVTGVTCVFGNTDVARVTQQTEKLLRSAGRPDIRLIPGAARPGDHDTLAAVFLAQTAAADPGKLIVLATGPLTNVAAAAAYDPAFFANVSAIHCMGGYFGTQQIGLRPAGELNLSADAAAAHAVLNGGAQVRLFVTEVCRQLPFRLRDLSLLRGIDTQLMRYICSWLALYGLSRGVGRFFLWDLLPALYVTHPDAFASAVTGARADMDALRHGRVVLRGHRDTVRAPQTLNDAAVLRRDIAAAWRTALPSGRPGLGKHRLGHASAA
ncbi:MAG: nucleoside hydrolase [Alphaproteobacteria bacterium]|nr:nucleoside hydrolase [Alphaproteobacteria bacterium]